MIIVIIIIEHSMFFETFKEQYIEIYLINYNNL